MSYEDVIRVAQAKIDPARFARIAAEVGAKPDEPLNITEFLQARHRRAVLDPAAAPGQGHPGVAERRPSLGRWHWGMQVNTASITGFLRFWLLARAAAMAPAQLSIPGGAARDRGPGWR